MSGRVRSCGLGLALVGYGMASFAQAEHIDSVVELQRVINNAGHRCDRIANIRPGARAEASDDVYVIVDCVDGSSHVLRISGHKLPEEATYFMDCKAWLNPVRCNS